MSQTLNINYDPYAPGTFAIQFTVNGVAPNLSTGYTATMRIWRSGLSTTAGPDVTATSAGGAISLGTNGAIVLDLVVIHAALAAVFGTNPSIWTYDLIVTPTGSYSQKVCSGQLAEGVGSDQTGDVSAPISVNWAGTVGGDLSGTLPNPTVDGLQGRAVASTAPTNGQVLAWNSTSSQWEPSSAAGGVSDGDKGDVLVASSGATWTVEGIQGRAVQNVAPVDGDILVWSAANSRYEPGQGNHAPKNAEYVVKTSSGGLTQERVLSDGSEVAFDWGTAGFVEPYVVAASISSTHLGSGSVGATQLQTNSVTLAKLQLPTSSRLLGKGTGSGNFEQLTTTGMVFGAGTVGVEFNNMFAGTGLTGGGKGDADRTISIATGGVTETLIADKAVKYAKIQDIGAASRLLGRGSASGSGATEEITIGSGLSMSGTTLSATATGTKTYAVFTPLNNAPPASNFATLDTRNSIPVLEFDGGSTDEYAIWVGIMPEAAVLTSGLEVRITWMADTATSGNVRWGVQFERGNTDLDTDSWDTAAEGNSAANGTSGIPTVASITNTNIDGITAGDLFRLRVYREASDTTNDTMSGDAQLIAVEIRGV